MTDIQKLDGICFLAFPEQKDFLISELKERFGLTREFSRSENLGKQALPATQSHFEDLIYLPDKSSFLQASGGKYPYWARTCMTEPFF